MARSWYSFFHHKSHIRCGIYTSASVLDTFIADLVTEIGCTPMQQTNAKEVVKLQEWSLELNVRRWEFRNTEIRVLFHIKCAQPNGKYWGKLQFVKLQVTVYDHCSRLAPLLVWRGLGCSPTAVEGFNSFRLLLFFLLLFFFSFFLPFFFFFFFVLYFLYVHTLNGLNYVCSKNTVRSKFFRLMPENHLRRASTTEHQLIRSMSRPRLH